MGAPLPVRAPPGGGRQLGTAQHGAMAQQRRRQWQGARATGPAPGQKDGSSGGAAEEHCSQAEQQAAQQATPPLLQQLARAAAGAAAAAVLALGCLPLPAEAVLANPKAQVPRSAEVALRRSIPAFNADVEAVQDKLEGIAFKLRIPQVGYPGW